MFRSSNGLLKRKRVGFLVSRRKMRKSIFDTFMQLCGKTGIDLVEVDLDRPLEEQGPFDLIIQKITDCMAAATDGNTQAIKTLNGLEMYIKNHPEVIVIDPMESIHKLFDRTTSYQIMKECEILEEGVRAFVPNFVQIDVLDYKHNLMTIENAGVLFPMMCKTVIGHGSELCHEMALIFNKEGLRDLTPPCVVQHFVNHDAILFKVFVAGNNHYIVERPSIKNYYKTTTKDKKTIFFSSHDVSKPDSGSYLSQLDEDDDNGNTIAPDENLVLKLVRKLQPKLNLTMFGIDIVVEKGTGHHVVIDINYFPGYEVHRHFLWISRSTCMTYSTNHT
ncbi:Inositol-tetrakisphosphate 1-kinase [Desmophyllum pertusum]|uniref:Inositol-tetrakisphosphate 1-kinase n=1 Tax=Desmophyllum pertusum TaxID=174260 RepID=A0A9W9YS87_9CNID|nr:Inositol-tetrakisphosphate 1-kinase [Desmophyllum pertusum]